MQTAAHVPLVNDADADPVARVTFAGRTQEAAIFVWPGAGAWHIGTLWAETPTLDDAAQFIGAMSGRLLREVALYFDVPVANVPQKFCAACQTILNGIEGLRR